MSVHHFSKNQRFVVLHSNVQFETASVAVNILNNLNVERTWHFYSDEVNPIKKMTVHLFRGRGKSNKKILQMYYGRMVKSLFWFAFSKHS